MKTHFRRCHVCGTVSSHDLKVEKCDCCGKHLTPFFYFDDSKVRPVSEVETKNVEKTTDEYFPIRGLTAFW